jgi:hypothetical protein
MKSYPKILAGIALFLLIFVDVHAQPVKAFRYFQQVRSEGFLSHDFFTGSDATDFTTSVNGFGSGLIDIFSGRSSIDVIQFGSDRLYVSIGAGFGVRKYRLAKNLVFGLAPDNTLTWETDPDPAHDYVNTFFGYGKSKIITTYFYFPVDLNVALGKNFIFTAGSYLDLNLTARYKMKYLDGGDKVKEIIRSPDFRSFHPNTAKIGFNATIYSRKLGYGLSATWSLTPFFEKGTGPDIHEARISATYAIRNPKSTDRRGSR